eukprot:6986132-Pyramimonas_sp.AAC.1
MPRGSRAGASAAAAGASDPARGLCPHRARPARGRGRPRRWAGSRPTRHGRQRGAVSPARSAWGHGDPHSCISTFLAASPAT